MSKTMDRCRKKKSAGKKSTGSKIREAKNPTKIQKMRGQALVSKRRKSKYA